MCFWRCIWIWRGVWTSINLKYGDVIVDLGPVALGDTLCDPHNVTTLLLLQFDVRIKDTEVELVQEGQFIQLHLKIIK